MPASYTGPAPASPADLTTKAYVDALVAALLNDATIATGTGWSSQRIIDVTVATFAPLTSPALLGNPTAPTQATADNDTSIATTAHVHAAIAADVPAASTSTAGRAEILTDAELDANNDGARWASGAQLSNFARHWRAANSTDVGTFKSRAREGDFCYQADTGDTWKKVGSSWKLWERPKTTWPTITFSSGFTKGNATQGGEYWVKEGFFEGSFIVTAGTTSAFTAGGIVFALALATETLTVAWHCGTSGRLTDGANVYPSWMLIPTTSNDLFFRLDDHATALGNVINSTLVYAAGTATGKSMQGTIRYPCNVTV